MKPLKWMQTKLTDHSGADIQKNCQIEEDKIGLSKTAISGLSFICNTIEHDMKAFK